LAIVYGNKLKNAKGSGLRGLFERENDKNCFNQNSLKIISFMCPRIINIIQRSAKLPQKSRIQLLKNCSNDIIIE